VLTLYVTNSLVQRVFLVQLIVDHLVEVFVFMKPKSTVTRKTTAKQWLARHVREVTLSTIEGRSLLGNKSLDTFPQQRINTRFRVNE
jgi:hypothetical protein